MLLQTEYEDEQASPPSDSEMVFQNNYQRNMASAEKLFELKFLEIKNYYRRFQLPVRMKESTC